MHTREKSTRYCGRHKLIIGSSNKQGVVLLNSRKLRKSGKNEIRGTFFASSNHIAWNDTLL